MTNQSPENVRFLAADSLDRHNSGVQQRISSLLRGPLFVVVCEHPFRFRGTADVIGIALEVEATRPTREEAQKRADFIVNESKGELHCYVLPRDEREELAALWANKPQSTF